jgi:cell division protein FtsI (penicillin-binding protein 3)
VEARGGSVIVTDPRTGEMLALASYPTYNPNEFGSPTMERRNRAITDRFEPGSTMKIFTVGGALDAGVVDAPAADQLLRRVVHHRAGHHPRLAPRDLAHAHAGARAVEQHRRGADRRGPRRDGLERAYRRFGFGERTGSPSPARPGRASGSPLVRGRGGHGGLRSGHRRHGHPARAGARAVANGGRLMPPLLVSRITDATGALVEDHPPSGVASRCARRREAAGEMLTSVTEEGGTGTEAAIPGVRVAGKTGTAQKANETPGATTTNAG